jgi:hypothetical protein
MVHLAKLYGGLGIPSLRVQYHLLNLAALVKSLNDEGTLGLVTRSLLRHQLRALQGLQPNEVPAEARYFRLCKQLALANEIGVHITMHGSPFVKNKKVTTTQFPRRLIKEKAEVRQSQGSVPPSLTVVT